MEIINVGDLHIKHEYPFNIAGEKFIDWLCRKDFNNSENIVVFSGDILDKSISSGEVNSLMISMFKRLEFRKIYVITGNHDLSRTKGSGLKPLSQFDNVTVIETPQIVMIEDLKTVMLPYYYPYTLKGYTTMERNYIDLSDDFLNADILYGHYTNESISMFGESIDTSYLKAKITMLGHIHHKGKDYLGTPVITRSDEAHKKSYITSYDPTTKTSKDIEVPMFLDYEDIYFDELSSYKEKEYPIIYDVYNIPSIEAVADIPKEIVTRNRFIKNEVTDEIMNIDDLDSDTSLVDYMNKYCDQYSINNSLRFKLVESIREKE